MQRLNTSTGCPAGTEFNVKGVAVLGTSAEVTISGDGEFRINVSPC
jgi:hypothetical protein